MYFITNSFINTNEAFLAICKVNYFTETIRKSKQYSTQMRRCPGQPAVDGSVFIFFSVRTEISIQWERILLSFQIVQYLSLTAAAFACP